NLTSGRIISPNLALKPLPRYRLEQITPKLSYYSAHPNKFLREIEQGIKINSYVFSDKSAIKPYNLVLPDSELEQCGKRLVTKTHYITEVVINPQLVKRRGYSFNLSCCRSSLIDFMILKSLNVVSINVGFYVII